MGIELRLVAPPGCELREHEEPETDLSHYLDAVSQALLSEPSVPVALFGHSLGASFAYLTALRLVAAGRPPVHLFLSAKESPDDPGPVEDLHLLDDRGLIDGVRTLYGGLPESLEDDPPLLASVLHRLRADLTLLSQVPAAVESPLRIPVSVLWSPEDPSMSESQVRSWDGRVSGPIRYEAFPGGHLFLYPQSAAVVRFVSDRLGIDVSGRA
jgi:surfactin synthase thioesterase subunit